MKEEDSFRRAVCDELELLEAEAQDSLETCTALRSMEHGTTALTVAAVHSTIDADMINVCRALRWMFGTQLWRTMSQIRRDLSGEFFKAMSPPSPAPIRGMTLSFIIGRLRPIEERYAEDVKKALR